MGAIQEKIDEHLRNHGHEISDIKAAVQDLTIDMGGEEYGSILEGMLVPRWKPWANIHKDGTALSADRFWMIQQLESQAPAGTAVEMGVYTGGVSFHFLKRCRNTMCFDTFMGIAGAGEEDDHEDGDYDVSEVNEYLVMELQKKAAKVFVGEIPRTLPVVVEPQSIAIAHIDLDVYGPTGHALDWCYRRLMSRGFIIVDDYGFASTPGVKKAVDEYPYGIKIYLPTGQMLIMKEAL